MNWYELVGTLASMITVCVYLVNGEKKIRQISLVGGVFFLAYGILIGAVSLICFNATCLVINIIKLRKLKKEAITNVFKI